MTPNNERLELPFPGCETCSHRLQGWHPEIGNTQLAAIVTASADAIVSVAPDGKFLSWNPGAEKMFGFTAAEAVGRSVELIVPPSECAESEALLAEARAGRQVAIRDTVRRQKDGTLIEVEVRASPICDATGEVKSIAAIYRDVSDRRRDERRQRMLVSELSHRSRNLFSVINSITRLSLASAISIETAKASLIGRLEALQRTYSRLTDAGFEGERLKEILDTELEAFEGRVQATGPEIMLTAKAVQTFALLVHELATNASKYGALSIPAGRVKLNWSVSGTGTGKRFRFDWIEGNGPPVTPPTRTGFGTTLITSIAASDFDCCPQLSYEADGFCYGFDAPLSQVGTFIEGSPVRRKLKGQILIALYDQWVRQLGAKGYLPKYRFFDRTPFEASGALTIATVGPGFDIQFIEVGHALLDRLGRALDNRDMTDEDPNSLIEAYRRCAKSARPSYEHVMFDFGDGESVNFERLLVPYSDTGLGVTHLVGIAIFSGETRARSDLHAKQGEP
jgi:PAS domain S-box-containing protein